MDIFLQNTLTKKKDKFEPLNKGLVTMYSCGPTVYNYLHIGNLRAYVFADILKRTLQYNGYDVKQIMNVTDIGHLTSDADEGEDKMVKALKRENKPMTLEGLRDVGRFYFEKAKEDMDALNILPADKYPFASEEIPAQVKLIKKLLKKGFAYKTSDGIYFDTSKFPNYGILGGVASVEHSRIGINAEKKDSKDFALWKFSDTESGIGFVPQNNSFLINLLLKIFHSGEKNLTIGKGFPGWHIECSAMAMRYLGEQFDIHTGGIDHIPVHHNNEIAQSESVTGKIPARFWLHNEHITIADEKMAKSGDNFLTLSFLKKEGVSPLAYRYWLLTSKYNTRVDYSLEAIKAAQTAFLRLRDFIADTNGIGNVKKEYVNKFNEAINNDLDTPKVLAVIWDLIKDNSVSSIDKKATILYFDTVLGLGLLSIKKEEVFIPLNIKQLLEERKLAKVEKDFAKADELRDKIKSLGYKINDTSENQEVELL